MTSAKDIARKLRISVFGFRFLLLLLPLLPAFANTPQAAAPSLPPPSTPREFFNAGTQKLHEGKLREAEAFLESALASQNDGLQPPALYNLGHVRFHQGTDELKKGPKAGPTSDKGRAATRAATAAIQEADQALAGTDLEKMVASYMHGRGARKELKDALKQVKHAMETHGAALGKWQRASGDFKSTVEVNPNDIDAQHNAETVDQWIARLVDSLREMQQMAQAMGEKNRELGEKLKKLKGNIPAQDMPPGGAGDDEEDEDKPFGPQPGQQEGPSKEGQQMLLSPEQAGWLLDAFKLDSERRLPMGQKDTAEPKDRNRPTW
ncbi:MAG TPA: hypothetical protein VN578_15985 [Candidatus Binatia bacterium]|jgi:hypothetical protein|nr:hypothetical protein [Candidatus Binatia bacterium]